MSSNQDQRPRFFQGQYLGAEDLTAAVEYSRIQQARHLLGAHTWGIATGLQLKELPLPGGRADVRILPGYAWDGFGRPIVVLAPYKIPGELFSGIMFQAGVDDTDQGKKGRLITVWLRYNEDAALNAPPECDAGNQPSRVRESFLVEIGIKQGHTDRHDSVLIAGQSVDAAQALKLFDLQAPLLFDESVPHQFLPAEGARSRWLIPIGYVRWLPVQNQSGHFVLRDDSDRPTGSSDPLKDSDKNRATRRYIGVVAEAIEAADGVIRLRDRARDPASSKFQAPLTVTDPKKPPENELVWVEGHLRVEGHVKLHTDGSLFAPGSTQNLRIIAGHVSESGGLVSGERFTVAHSSVGAYSVLFADPFPSAPVVVTSPVNAGKNDTLLTLRNLTGNGFDIVSTDVTPGGTGENKPQDTAYTFIAMGLR
jgi:hypothetical protein